jgi:hypothetical protein
VNLCDINEYTPLACANLVSHMAEGDNLVDHPLDLKLVCQLRDLKE